MSGLRKSPLPELPPVCLSCGGRRPLRPRKVIYTRMAGGVGTVVALLGGGVDYDMTIHRLELPLCAACAGSGRRKNLVLLLMWPVVLGLFALALKYGLTYPVLFALPVVFTVAAFAWAALLQGRERPKPVRVDEDHLVINVPGYGRPAARERRGAETQPRGLRRLRLHQLRGCGRV
jgi:hypothetical protein